MSNRNKIISIISIIIAFIILFYTYLLPISYLTIKYKRPFIGCFTIFYLPERYGFDLNYWDIRWKDAEWTMRYGDNIFGVSAEGIAIGNKNKISFNDDYQRKMLIEWVVEDLQQNVNENIIYADHLACRCGGYEEWNKEYPNIWTKENSVESLGCYDPYIYVYCENINEYVIGDVSRFHHNDYVHNKDATQKCVELERAIREKTKEIYGTKYAEVIITNSKTIGKEEENNNYNDDTVILKIIQVN